MKQNLTLRPYQQRSIQAARESLIKNPHTILYSPCGSGKSVECAFMAENAAERGYKTLILSHRAKILRQNFSKMEMLGLQVQQITAITKYIHPSQIYIGMAQTIDSRCKSKQEWIEWMRSIDFVIADECQRAEIGNIFKYLREDCWVVGLTATPIRHGTQRQLGDEYSDISAAVTTEELITLGHIVRAEYYKFQAPLLTSCTIDRDSGDYNQKQLHSIFAKPERYAGIIDNYRRICCGEKTLCFTTGARHCIDLCKEFCAAGFRAKYYISSRDKETYANYSGTQESLVKQLEKGDIDILLSITSLDVGTDIPSLQAILLDFSTKSYTRYLQAAARGDRPYPGKLSYKILDFGGNHTEFGAIEGDAPMALWHKIGGNGVMPTKLCPPDKTDCNGRTGCNRLVPVSTIDCPFKGCGFHFQTHSEVYEVTLTKVVEAELGDYESLEGYVARMKLEHKDNNYILINICIKNAANPKKAFMEAIKLMQKKDGTYISPQYWHFFSRNLLKDKAQKQLAKEKAAINNPI